MGWSLSLFVVIVVTAVFLLLGVVHRFFVRPLLADAGAAASRAVQFQELRERFWDMELARIRLKERTMSAAVEQAAEAVLITTPEGKVEYVNPAFTAMTGFAHEEVVGNTVDLIDPAGNPREVAEEMWQAIRDGAIWNGSVSGRKKNGLIFPGTMTVVPVMNRDGELTSLVVVRNDTSERLQNERELARSQNKLAAAREMAEGASRAKNEFLAKMSHELRTPLNAVIGFSSLMLHDSVDPLSEKQREYLRDISQSGLRLLNLLNDILELCRLDFGRLELDYSEVKIRPLVEETLICVQKKAQARDIGLVVEFGDHIDSMEADSVRIGQVLVNLLSNAVKFSPDNGRVRVRVQTVPASVASGQVSCQDDLDLLEVVVEDNGPGIEPEDTDKLFAPFSQLGSVYQKTNNGTGLGLAICKRIIDAHGGLIWVESEPGQGSRFFFRIPKARSLAPACHKDEERLIGLLPARGLNPVTGIVAWEYLVSQAERVCSYHCRVDQPFGIIRLECVSDDPAVDYLALTLHLKQYVRGHEILTHGERDGVFYVFLLGASREETLRATGRFSTTVAEFGLHARIRHVTYPDNGETVGDLLARLRESASELANRSSRKEGEALYHAPLEGVKVLKG